MNDYYERSPERFHFLDNGNEITIQGFVDFAAPKLSFIKVRQHNGVSSFIDPWGDPIRFIQMRDSPRLKANGIQDLVIYGSGNSAYENPHGLGIMKDKNDQALLVAGEQRPIIILKDYKYEASDAQQDAAANP